MRRPAGRQTVAADRHAEAELRIRAAMRRLLDDGVPEGHKCDVTSLCNLAGVPRATFYRTYPHLRVEFEEDLGRLRSSGHQPDSRLAQIQRLKDEVIGLRERLSKTDGVIAEFDLFRSSALSRLASQHDEIMGLRRELDAAQGSRLFALPEA